MNILTVIKKWFSIGDKKNESINVIDSIAKAKKLYRYLILQAHPDRHPQKRIIAEELTDAINNNKYNYEQLLILKNRVEKELL